MIRFHEKMRRELRSAKDIHMLSLIFLIIFLVLFLCSFCIQALYINQRGTARDIHTTQFNLLVDIANMRSDIMHRYFEHMQTNDFSLRLHDMQMNHQLLLNNFSNTQVKNEFLVGEQTYISLLSVGSIFLLHAYTVTTTDVETFFYFTEKYCALIAHQYSEYTMILAKSNADSTAVNIIAVTIDIAIVSLFFFFLFFPTVKRLLQSVNDHIEASEKLEEARRENEAIIREIPATIYQLPVDVVSIGKNTYMVAGNGRTYVVVYDPEKKLFICECDIFKRCQVCFHGKRAQWLQKTLLSSSVS